VRESTTAWLDLIRTLEPQVVVQINKLWDQVVDTLQKDLRVHKVWGILSNIVYILLEARWNLLRFNLWEKPDGSQWQLTSQRVSPTLVATALAQSCFRQDRVRASAHHNGVVWKMASRLIILCAYSETSNPEVVDSTISSHVH
jgi:hypothetical protein